LADLELVLIGDLRFPPESIKHLQAQRRSLAETSAIPPVFNEEKARKPLAAWGRTPIRQRPWRRLDGNVQIVTQLHLADLV
jgi:hypothetical protein